MKKKASFRMMSMLLAVLVCISFMPVFDGAVSARSAKEKVAENAQDVSEIKAAETARGIKSSKEAAKPCQTASEAQKILNSKQKTKVGKKSDKSFNKAFAKNSKLGASSDPSLLTVSSPDANGIVRVQGNINSSNIPEEYKPYVVYDKVYVDDLYTVERNIGSNIMNITIDMKNYSVGYHTIAVTYIINGKDRDPNGKLIGTTFDYVPTYIYNSPSNAPGLYDVYNKKFYYNNVNGRYAYDSSCSVQMQHRIKGKKKYGKWIGDGYMTNTINYVFPGLKPARKFQTRLYYCKKFTYKGQEYTFTSGRSAVRTMKAGTKKMKVKSITVKAYNVKRHPRKLIYRHWTSYWTYVWRVRTIGYYYTYNLRATVRLKKKPGAKGIMINAYRLKGNKKVYTKKLGKRATYTKPGKNKYIIYVTSYQNKKYGGWSPQIKKKCRIR